MGLGALTSLSSQWRSVVQSVNSEAAIAGRRCFYANGQRACPERSRRVATRVDGTL